MPPSTLHWEHPLLPGSQDHQDRGQRKEAAGAQGNIVMTRVVFVVTYDSRPYQRSFKGTGEPWWGTRRTSRILWSEQKCQREEETQANKKNWNFGECGSSNLFRLENYKSLGNLWSSEYQYKCLLQISCIWSTVATGHCGEWWPVHRGDWEISRSWHPVQPTPRLCQSLAPRRKLKVTPQDAALFYNYSEKPNVFTHIVPCISSCLSL